MFCFFKKSELTLDKFRKILKIAKRDGKDYEESLWWADLVTSMCGVENMVRDNISTRKPTMNKAIVDAQERIGEIREDAEKDKKKILDDAEEKAVDLREKANSIERMANFEANIIARKADFRIHEKKNRIDWAKQELEDIAEIEYIIAKGLAEE